MIEIKDIPNAKKNGIKWLMASGVKNDEEALKLADKFIKKAKDMVR
jgi:hypothetical protein